MVTPIPERHFRLVVVSAGTNDPPGVCVGSMATKWSLLSDAVVFIAPVNGARAHVIAVARKTGSKVLTYTPSRRRRVYPHPDACSSFERTLGLGAAR